MDTPEENNEEVMAPEENEQSASAIENEISLGKSLFGSQNFDETRFRQDAERARQEDRDFRSLNKNDYLKRKDPPGLGGGSFSSPNLSFSAKFEDGVYSAADSQGNVIKSRDFEDFTTRLALSFKNTHEDTQNPPFVKFKDNKNTPVYTRAIRIADKNFY